MELVVVGATGMCASTVIKTALAKPNVSKIWAFARRDLDLDLTLTDPHKLEVFESSNIDEWEKKIPEAADNQALFFSGIATTRAAAGGLDKQRLVDYDLQLRLAKAAKAKGYKTFVLVSSIGANTESYLSYLKLKGEIEKDIQALEFDRTFILRPGVLIGRGKSHSGFGANLMESIMPKFYRTKFQGLVQYPTHADDVAKATFELAKTASKGVTIVEGATLLDIASKE